MLCHPEGTRGYFQLLYLREGIGREEKDDFREGFTGQKLPVKNVICF